MLPSYSHRTDPVCCKGIAAHGERCDIKFSSDINASRAIKSGTQFGTQKCAERAVDAVHAARIFPRKFSAC